MSQPSHTELFAFKGSVIGRGLVGLKLPCKGSSDIKIMNMGV